MLLKECYVEVMQITGKPYNCTNLENSQLFNVKNAQYASLLSKSRRSGTKRIYWETLAVSNFAFRYTAQVMEFVTLLNTADRFTQHCILHGVEYTEENKYQYDQNVINQKEELEGLYIRN